MKERNSRQLFWKERKPRQLHRSFSYADSDVGSFISGVGYIFTAQIKKKKKRKKKKKKKGSKGSEVIACVLEP